MRSLSPLRQSEPDMARVAAADLPRRDPAPTRLAYRLNRLWLTPLFRASVRVGLPAFVGVMAVGIYLADPERRAAIGQSVVDLRQSIEERPEFMVRLIAIDGASPVVAEAVRRMLPVNLPASSFQLDIEGLHKAVTDLDAIQSANLYVRAGGILQIDIAERVPAILWRTAASVEMLDTTGHRVATLLRREARADLPLVAGEGADRAVPEALALFHAAQPIADRVRGLVRMGERRWDVVLDRGQRIMLPEDDAASALARVIALHEAQDLLNRDIVAVDMRNGARPTLRLSAQSAAELRGTDLQTRVSGE